MKYFSINPVGGLGNRIIAYMAALAVGRRLAEPIKYNCSLPELGLEFDIRLHDKLRSDPGCYIVNDLDAKQLDEVVGDIRRSDATAVIFHGLFQRYDFFAPVEFYRGIVLTKQPLDIPAFDDNDLVINVRAGDVLGGDFAWYPLVPVNFFRNLIATTKRSPVFLGQLDDCAYVAEIRKAFPQARMIPSGGAMVDFNRLLHAGRLCVAISTFSWLAAWLSEATEIHYPLLGFLHPFCHPRGVHSLGGIDLTPLGDSRYRYHLFPILNAQPEQDYLRHTNRINPISHAVPATTAENLSRQAKTWHDAIDVLEKPNYFNSYLDAAWQIASGNFGSAQAHYDAIGRIHGYSLNGALPRPPFDNIALHKKASQSSVCEYSLRSTVEADAAGAVDGVLDGYYSFHTETEDAPWWKVDLGNMHTISEIWVFNRIEPPECAYRAQNLAIDIGDDQEVYTEVFRYASLRPFGGNDGKPLIAKLDEKVFGRFVRLRLRDRNPLHLAQVEVFGCAHEDTEDKHENAKLATWG